MVVVDNPDQRLSEDVDTFTRLTMDLALATLRKASVRKCLCAIGLQKSPLELAMSGLEAQNASDAIELSSFSSGCRPDGSFAFAVIACSSFQGPRARTSSPTWKPSALDSVLAMAR